LEKIKGIFNVMEMTGQHLMERPVPSANGDFEVTVRIAGQSASPSGW
jgi:hypothetical protein